jgi:hypothetical protein
MIKTPIRKKQRQQSSIQISTKHRAQLSQRGNKNHYSTMEELATTTSKANT